jgi:hypothetical protein
MGLNRELLDARHHQMKESGPRLYLMLKDIDVEVVEAFVAKRGHLSKKTVANHLTLLIAMLHYADESEMDCRGPTDQEAACPRDRRVARGLLARLRWAIVPATATAPEHRRRGFECGADGL